MDERNGQTSAEDNSYDEQLINNARRISARGRGILASDESTGTIGKRLTAAGLNNDEDTRRRYRQLLYTGTGIGRYLSGAILFDETVYQKTDEGERFVDVLNRDSVMVGVKVDKGLRPLPRAEGESFTEGLDGLADRCAEYYKQSARFVKWRSALTIDVARGLPSAHAIAVNALGLASYANIAQLCGLVPIVEPEILIDGKHDIATSAAVAERVISETYAALRQGDVLLEGTLLKPMMVMPGTSCTQKADADEVARLTLRTMQRCVPAAVPGIMFLSGGMSEREATINLDRLNRLADSGQRGSCAPWSLSFSYGRALQSSVLKLWAGKPENVNSATAAAVALSKANSEAQLGRFEDKFHPSVLDSSLVENFRGWRTSYNVG